MFTKYLPIAFLIAVLLTGTATGQDTPGIDGGDRDMLLDDLFFSGPDNILTEKEKRAVRIAEAWQRGEIIVHNPVVGPDGSIEFLYGAERPSIVCAVMQISQNVYDTPTGKHLLIPQGARLVGEYSSQVQYGQSRVFAVWQRIIYPDGKALDIGSSPGSSGAGYAGFRDRVNNHYVRIFGSAIMMSAILAGVEMTQNNSNNDSENTQRMSDALSESLGQVLGGVIGEMLSKNMSIAPTIEIRPGYRLNVMLVKDLVFPGPYRSFDYVSQ